MHQSHSVSTRSNRIGAETVEFAIVFPIVLMFAFASIEFARVANVRHALHSASYEAARVAIVPGATATEAEDRAEDVLSRHGLRLTSISISPSVIEESTGDVTVEINAEMVNNAWSLLSFTAGVSLASKTTLLTERAPSILVDAIPELPPPSDPDPPPADPDPPPTEPDPPPTDPDPPPTEPDPPPPSGDDESDDGDGSAPPPPPPPVFL